MSREKLVGQLIDAFRLYGYDGASLSCLAKVTGLGKTNLYHYFPGGKEEMAEAALERVNTWLETCILQPLSSNAAPSDKLQMMCDQVSKFFNEGQNSCLWAVLALERSSNDLFHNQIKSALSQWIEAIAAVLKEAGLEAHSARHRAEDAVLRIQGALVLARGLDDTTPFQRLMKTLAAELLKSQ
ncbi:TetR/AcrR family transcriptional regulator [Leptolyngbya sp. FACHB-671]|uniref:TetR/AcrR family transcriptional regulator n=1 Tax=unclassified Leptolyngbya TaxID=2650499 RepID=UPI00168249F0|nr:MULTISPECIES: TetR/AcrR family transcriptional regulator [unclassified Leptolyngbya]MBD2001085.1 TetR/AcrR family transcriptional regulator [Leptolyngbya sp. FACHB-541]MBD2066148.1 TetR/AcrR family transcriptional regulator [Leptolyngbya sp. FACHB-671]